MFLKNFCMKKRITHKYCISMREAARLLSAGGIGVIPTDTLYGLVCCAQNEKAVERVYRARRRNPQKPCIILIPDKSFLASFKVFLESEQERVIDMLWPGPISIIFSCKEERFFYLHRGTETLAFRVPHNPSLLALLRETGPLIAPSANWEGGRVAETIEEAKKYFEKSVDFFVNGGRMRGLGSTLIAFEEDGIVLKRQGTVDFRNILSAIGTH